MRNSERFATWASELIDGKEALDSGAWPRAAALLGRSALEAAMAEMWSTKEPGISNASWRAQLLCLSGYLDKDLAANIAYTYSALSSACHYHPYDLPPTAPEIRRWLDVVDQLVDATNRPSGP